MAENETIKEGAEKKSGLATIEPSVQKSHTEPWKPAPILQVKPILGFRLHWVRKDDLDRRRLEGWEPVEGKDLLERTIVDGSQMDSSIAKRNLVLCKMPEERAKQMDAYYANKSKDAVADSVKAFEESGDKGLSYGSIKVSHE